jgi:(S)-2-hydroxyglutarate dehydrogenase
MIASVGEHFRDGTDHASWVSNGPESCYDVVIVGAGIVGLATAMKLIERRPGLKAAVLDKESGVARHQTGHNSGVIHSGIYYRPGSLKAHTCLSGARQLVRFCREHDIPFEICGKVVVATEPGELPRLDELLRRGRANGVHGLRLITREELREIEPHAAGLQALHVPSTGITDYTRVAQAYSRVFRDRGGQLLLNHQVLRIRPAAREIHLETNQGVVSTRTLVNCGGLYADHLARRSGIDPHCRIVPFRGEYYQVRPQRRHLVNNLIYPVPDPRLPFLGVHFTRMIDGGVEAGPNAVLAWAREGYRKTDLCCKELAEIARFSGFWRLAARYWRSGLQEMARSCSRRRFARSLRKLVPEIEAGDLAPGGTGVRAQALSTAGALLDDFVVVQNRQMLHVLNAPSPAATSALAIADHLLDAASSMLE